MTTAKRFFEEADVQRAILRAIAAKPTGTITAHELRNAVADALATQMTPAFLRAFRRSLRRMLLDGELTSRSLGAVFTGAR